MTAEDPEGSALHRVITLPDDDPEIMPPKGDPLSKTSTMIKRWIWKELPNTTVAADPNAAPKPKKTETASTEVDAQESFLDVLAKRAGLPSKVN